MSFQISVLRWPGPRVPVLQVQAYDHGVPYPTIAAINMAMGHNSPQVSGEMLFL